MRFDWSEYLNIAREIAALPSDNAAIDEARMRSAVSRAYYAVFCLARNYLRDIQKDPRLAHYKIYDLNEHKYVAEEFIYNQFHNKKMIKIGEKLSRLRDFRNKADYADVIFNVRRDVNNALNIAEAIMKLLNELREENQ